MKTRKDNTLESLDEKVRSWILETAAYANLTDMVVTLQKEGISTSVPSLSRFVRRHQEEMLLMEGREMKAAVDELAERGKDGRLRAGTVEAVRQRLYEQALQSRSPEEARLLYAALVKEETKLKELELEARKVAIAEEQLKLDALVARAKVLAGRVKVVSEENGDGAPETANQIATAETKETKEVKQLAGPSEREKRLTELVSEVSGILNSGGDLNERMMEARAVLAEGVKALSLSSDL